MRLEISGFNVEVVVGKYNDGGIAVSLVDVADGSPFATVSVRLPQTAKVPAGAFFVKDWAENREVVDAMVAAGVLVPANDVPKVSSGFIAEVSAYRLKS